MNVWGKMKTVTLGGMVVGAMMLASTFSVTGCLTDDKKDSTPVKDTTHHTALGTEATLSAGGQGHPTLGSVLDLDAGKVMLSAAANAAQADIDLVLLFYTGGWHLENAVMAKASGITNSIKLTDGYDDTKIKDLKIVKLTAKPADQEDAKAKLAAGTAIKGSVIVGGEYFVMNTTGGKVAVVYVKSVIGTDNKGAGDFTFSLLSI